MGDTKMKKLNKTQLRNVILQEMKDLEEARLGKKGKEYIEKTGRFGKLASFGVDRLLQTELFDEMMLQLKRKLFTFGIDPNEMAEIEKLLSDYIVFETPGDTMPMNDSDGMTDMGADVDSVGITMSGMEDLDGVALPAPDLDIDTDVDSDSDTEGLRLVAELMARRNRRIKRNRK